MQWTVAPGVEPRVKERVRDARYAVHREVTVQRGVTERAWSGIDEEGVAEICCTTPAPSQPAEEPSWGSAVGDVTAWSRAVCTVLLGAIADGQAHARDDHSAEAPLPQAVSLPTDLLTLSGAALALDRSQVVADLTRAHSLHERAAQGRWRTAAPARALQVLQMLHGGALGHLRLVAVDRGGSEPAGREGPAEQPPLMMGWVLHADGWRELVAGGPGVTRVVRRAPEVLADRLRAAFEVVR